MTQFNFQPKDLDDYLVRTQVAFDEPSEDISPEDLDDLLDSNPTDDNESFIDDNWSVETNKKALEALKIIEKGNKK
jgi:hypothetical protein